MTPAAPSPLTFTPPQHPFLSSLVSLPGQLLSHPPLLHPVHPHAADCLPSIHEREISPAFSFHLSSACTITHCALMFLSGKRSKSGGEGRGRDGRKEGWMEERERELGRMVGIWEWVRGGEEAREREDKKERLGEGKWSKCVKCKQRH